MQTISNANFGPLIAYLVPGATALLGASVFFPTLSLWFATAPSGEPTIGGFLYLTIASLAAGMIVSAVRWTVIDTLHAWTGLPMPELDFSKLGRNVEAFGLLIRIHYEHFQFFANMLVATAIAYACYHLKFGVTSVGATDIGFALIETIFFVTSRDCLRKYYSRSEQLLRFDR